MASSRLEDAHRPEHVDRGVLDRVLDRDAHVRLRREVEDGLGPNCVEEVVERLADVADVQLGAAAHVLGRAVDERVDDGHLVAARDERVDDVRADEAGSSGHDRPHDRILRTAVGWRSMFVTFEGLDGSGKSTQAELLRARLEADGVDVVSTREPGGTELGERIRDLVLHGGHVTPWAEALLYVAARAQHVDEVIRPALDAGRR